MISSYDLVGLGVSDTSIIFNIFDGISPEIILATNLENLSFPEHYFLEISWNAYDNIALDSVSTYYSNDNGENYNLIGNIDGTQDGIGFFIPEGVTDQAKIILKVYDTSGNFSYDTSAVFSITDYTPPISDLVYPGNGESFDIDSELQILWNATDNVDVIAINIDYSTDQGGTWKNITADMENNGQLNWIVPNDPSANARFRLIAFDGVGLSDTAVVDSISINIVYPKVTSVYPDPGSISWLDREVSIQFSQKMLEGSLNDQSITLVSYNFDDIDASYIYVDSTRTVNIKMPSGFAGLDTVAITLNSLDIKSHYGYALDGDGNGAGGDEYTFEYIVGIAGDFNGDQLINGADLSMFISSYKQNDFYYEMGPYLGEVPHLKIIPDSLFNIEDVMSFVVLGNWYLENYGLNMNFSESNSNDLEINLEKNHLSILIPPASHSFDMEIIHDKDNFIPSYASTKGSISLVKSNIAKGKFQVISETGLDKIVNIPFELHK